jgi:hypothetical protein
MGGKKGCISPQPAVSATGYLTGSLGNPTVIDRYAQSRFTRLRRFPQAGSAAAVAAKPSWRGPDNGSRGVEKCDDAGIAAAVKLDECAKYLK